MQTPQNLKIWKCALDLATETYRLTAGFPSAERFGLTAHMRKDVLGISSRACGECSSG